MAISLKQHADNNNYSTSTTTCPSPTLGTAATAGNALVLAVVVDKNGGAVTTPSGWTQIMNQAGASVTLAVFGKVAAGGETGVGSAVSWTTAQSGAELLLMEWQGTATSSPFGVAVTPAYSDTAGTSKSLGPITAANAGVCLAVLGIDSLSTATGFNVTATGFTADLGSLHGTPAVGSGAPAVAVLHSADQTGGATITATTFSWTDSDQVQGTLFVLFDAPTSTNYTANPSDQLAASDALPLLPPDGLTATVVSSTAINLSWALAADAASYDIERDGTVIATGLTGTSYADTGLTASTTYTYNVRVVRIP